MPNSTNTPTLTGKHLSPPFFYAVPNNTFTARTTTAVTPQPSTLRHRLASATTLTAPPSHFILALVLFRKHGRTLKLVALASRWTWVAKAAARLSRPTSATGLALSALSWWIRPFVFLVCAHKRNRGYRYTEITEYFITTAGAIASLSVYTNLALLDFCCLWLRDRDS